jgi:hypothetical protein
MALRKLEQDEKDALTREMDLLNGWHKYAIKENVEGYDYDWQRLIYELRDVIKRYQVICTDHIIRTLPKQSESEY